MKRQKKRNRRRRKPLLTRRPRDASRPNTARARAKITPRCVSVRLAPRRPSRVAFCGLPADRNHGRVCVHTVCTKHRAVDARARGHRARIARRARGKIIAHRVRRSRGAGVARAGVDGAGDPSTGAVEKVKSVTVSVLEHPRADLAPTPHTAPRVAQCRRDGRERRAR